MTVAIQIAVCVLSRGPKSQWAATRELQKCGGKFARIHS